MNGAFGIDLARAPRELNFRKVCGEFRAKAPYFDRVY
jgi:hypothetical protein